MKGYFTIILDRYASLNFWNFLFMYSIIGSFRIVAGCSFWKHN